MRASLRRGAPGPQPQVKCSKWIQNGFCGSAGETPTAASA